VRVADAVGDTEPLSEGVPERDGVADCCCDTEGESVAEALVVMEGLKRCDAEIVGDTDVVTVSLDVCVLL